MESLGYITLNFGSLILTTISGTFCDADKVDELEMVTDSLYLALSEENLDVILPVKQK